MLQDMSHAWPNRDQADFLSHTVLVYRALFMSRYKLGGSLARSDFWENVMVVYFEHFPPPEDMSMKDIRKDIAQREMVSYFNSFSTININTTLANQALCSLAGKGLDYMALRSMVVT